MSAELRSDGCERLPSEYQRKAIEHGEGPMLVLAGPGSGKTFVITGRVRYLIRERKVSPESILVITFTKAAALEMKERYLRLDEEDYTAVTFSTFHAFFYQILKFSYRYESHNILTLKEKRNYIREILASAEEKDFFYSDVELMLLEEIGFIKNMGSDPALYNSEVVEKELFPKIYQEYESKKSFEKKIDFEDMVLQTFRLFNSRPDVLDYWQKRYRYILIDEFQDINKMQYDTIGLLAKPHHNLFCVGDDDQSIYGFRGASPGVMKQFLIDYPEGKQTLLPVNYRCTDEILNTAQKLIAVNKERFDKNLRAVKKSHGSVVIQGFDQASQEHEMILKLLEEGSEKRDATALIFRTNIGMAEYAELLTRNKIPYICREKIKSVYDEPVAKDILAYLAFSKGERTRANFFRIMNRPVRYISRNRVKEPVDLQQLLGCYQDQPQVAERIRRLIYDMNMLSKMSPFAAVNYIRRGMGYDEYLFLNSGGMKKEGVLKVAEEMMRNAANFADYREWNRHIRLFEEELSAPVTEKKHGVVLTTMHGSKGLEWERVIIPDLNERNVPHKRAILPAQLEEERRLFYVALTRARERLYLFYLNRNAQTMTELSRFLHEIKVENRFS